MPISSINILNFPWNGSWIRFFGKELYKKSILLYHPKYILLNLHSWDFVPLKSRKIFSRNSGIKFKKMLKDLFLYCISKDYIFMTITECINYYKKNMFL